MIDTTLLSGIYGAEKPDDPNGKPEYRLGIDCLTTRLYHIHYETWSDTLIPMEENILRPCGNGLKRL